MGIKDLLLSKTEFSMKGDLPKKSLELKEWLKNDIYKKLREQSISKEKFIFTTDHLMQMASSYGPCS